ncbi:MAG: DUF4397 domain-containing protein [Cellulosilyticaceae bacterium]
MKEKKIPPKTFIRFFNANPSTDFLDFYIDDHCINSHQGYEDFTKYTQITSGQHQLSIAPHKEKEFILTKRINLRPHSIFTLVAAPSYRGTEPLSLFSIEETSKITDAENCYIRTCSFSPSLPPSDFSLIEDYYIFKNIKYAVATTYLPFKIGPYPISLVNHSDASSILSIPPVLLKPKRFYTSYLIGLNTKAFPLKTIISIDGRSYLKIKKNAS